MPYVDVDGEQKRIPGVYVRTSVETGGVGPTPAFHVPILLASGPSGHPYNATVQTGETPPTPFKFFGSPDAAAAYYGQWSDIHRSLVWAFRHRLPFAYVVNLCPLTRASVVATSTGPVNELQLFPRLWGAPGHLVGVTYAANVLTLTPVKRYAMLAANSGAADKRIYLVGDVAWLTVGSTVRFMANAVANVSRTVVRTGSELSSTGQRSYWVDVDTAPGALTTAGYAVAWQWDTAGAFSKDFTGLTGQDILDWLNGASSGKLLWGIRAGGYTGALPIATTLKPFGQLAAWAAPTLGTSPVATSADVDAFILAMKSGQEDEFASKYQVMPRTYYLAMTDQTSQVSMRDYELFQRARGPAHAISVNSGFAWGTTDVGGGGGTDPLARAVVLNSQGVQLWAGGLDREAPVVSGGPMLWAQRVRGGPGHNLTNDEILASEREIAWDEVISGDLSSLLRNGIVTYKLSIGTTIRYRVVQGLSTLQANAAIWNPDGATTYSTRQRDLADFVNATLQADYEEYIIGADIVDANALAALLVRRGQETFLKRSLITEFRIRSIVKNDAGNGWKVQWSVNFGPDSDYLEVETIVTT